jgi:GSH-dependent disulfide-bond oxidoreductase
LNSGLKTTIALAELDIPHENHLINILKGEQLTPEYLKVNPNNKIPAIVDPNGASAPRPKNTSPKKRKSCGNC